MAIVVVLCVVQAVPVLRVVFPVFIVGLMIIRWFLGFCFTRKDLEVLDDPLPERLYCKRCRGRGCRKKHYDVNVEEGSTSDDVDVCGSGVIAEEPSADDQHLSSRHPSNNTDRRSSEFNFTQEVDKCDAWKTVVKDLDVPYSSPRRTHDESRPSITITDVERTGELDSSLFGPAGMSPLEETEEPPSEHFDFVPLEQEKSTAMMLEEQSKRKKSRACRKLFNSTAV